MDSPPSVQLEEEVGDEPIEEDNPAIMPADKFTLPSRADEVLNLWRTKMEEGVLSPSHFLDHWRVTVPRIYSPQPNRNCLGWIFDEELASKLLIQPLEQFVWGTEKGEQPVAPSRATLCGRVFKQGEPAYSCRECGMDNTCVLCVECFKVSAHRHHKYKMGQSGGGGCCDCGDLEAWKKEPFCELHSSAREEEKKISPPSESEVTVSDDKTNLKCPTCGKVYKMQHWFKKHLKKHRGKKARQTLASNEKMEQSDDGIKPEVVERMKIVANVILSYCFRLLTLEHAPDLPNDLKLKDAERDPLQVLDQVDCYCTVLYNDETHTFEQVISTLSRVMNSDHRDSVELVTLIDREGRAIVKCSSFSLCDKLKTDIERYATQYGPTLKVLVLHAHVAAHQMFAMKLLQWLQQFVSAESKLRIAVSTEALGEEKGNPGVVVGVMQNDCNMWKAARTAWHRLLISTTLMDYNSKKRLSILFTKNYGSIMKDFIRDDHDHSCSVSSLSVQLYTTPTLAHHLIAKHGALATVLNTFVSECTRRCKKGRLEFVRDHTMNTFKRAQFILYDVKYLLSAVPTVWDDELRQGFLHGLNLLLNLFTMMQGMEPVTRQVGQHMEYEPDWESAFNLHVKLTHSITLALEWCGSDRTITAKAYRMTLRHLAENDMCREPHARVKMSHPTQWQDTLVIAYDVSKQPVSIHQPLSRFLAGLHLLLDRYGFSYNSPEFTLSDKPKPMAEQLIEPMLRVAVLMAQVHMGMWRRNGFSLLNQLYFYHNVKCRAEMLDRDIIMLQIGASLIESNEFLVHVLNKYSLVACMSPQIEDLVTDAEALRPVSFMVEECLELLTNVIGSRYVPGVGEVTQEERIKKEIIQMLCVKPMAHSELNRCLTEDQVHETGLEAVIDEVADFNRSTSGAVRGKYTLKPHLYDEYDMFFYHYTKEDLSRSEERQRNRRKAEGLPECCPPPPLPKLTQPFRMIANLMQCEAALYVLKTVFERALDLTSKCFSEGQVHKALHLMGYALRDEESGHYEFLSFAESAHRAGLHTLMQQLAVSPRVTAMRPLLLWTLQKMRSLLSNDADKVGDAESMETDQEEKPANDDDNEKARRTKLAAERRSALMAQMEAARNSFMSNNATMFAEAMAEDEAREAADTSLPTPRTALGGWGAVGDTQSVVCMLCQEEARVEIQSPAVVMVAFVQYSTVIRRVDAASHVSSCGHTLHASCYKKYVDTVVDKENRRPYRLRQPAAFDIENKEYLCPLCERLCNTALPLLPTPPLPSTDPPPLSEEMYEQCTDIVLKHQGCLEAVHCCTEECQEMHCIAVSITDESFDMDNMEQDTVVEADTYVMTHSKEIVPKEFLEHFNMEVPAYDERMGLLLDDFANILSKVCNYDRNLDSTWALGSFCKATAYTLMCANASLRVEERPLLGELPARIRETLRALVRVAAAVPALWPASRQAAHHALTALNKLERSSPAEHDTFITLTTLVFCSPALFAHRAAPARPANLTRQFALRALRCALVRAALSDEPMDQDSQRTQIPDISTWPVLKQRCHTFLRRCCLLFYFLSDVEPPTKLTELNGDTWEAMCEYLNLPSSYEELLGSDSVKRKIQQWTELSEKYFETGISRYVVVERFDPPNLIDLPDDFSELMNIVSEFSCPNSESEDCKYPTMCLTCGEILCSQSYCCQSEVIMIGRQSRVLVGAVMSHVLNCGGSAGIFLRVRDCEMLLLAAPGRGVMTPAPYLDSYGETDQGLRRGNPLRLCTERYAALRKMWLNHGIQERIARPNDYHIHVTTQWVNM